MPLSIAIVTGSSVSIYRQIVEQVCAAVFAGNVAEDETLPSVRALAEQLLINPNTVARAYGELVREGVLESRAGRGMFIARRRRQIYSSAERARRIDQAATSLVAEGLMLGFSPRDIVELVERKTQELKPPGSGGGARSARLETMKGPAR
jgi:GntR family transcriptional regulator